MDTWHSKVNGVNDLIDDATLNDLNLQGSRGSVDHDAKFLIESHLERRPLKFEFFTFVDVLVIGIDLDEIGLFSYSLSSCFFIRYL